MCDDFRTAKIGDRVYSVVHGWGTVTSLHLSADYPVVVYTDSFGTFNFTACGSYCLSGPQVLFWDDPKIIPPLKPKTKVKRWIKGLYGFDGRLFLAGDGMAPTTYVTKSDAEDQQDRPPFELAFVVEVEINEDSIIDR